MTDVRSLLAGLADRRPVVIDLGLDRMLEALARVGNPHQKLPPVFHVAGTNGKGSTIAFLRAILEASGARVHVFTSPHLVRFNERIVLAGEEISDEYLVDVINRCDHAVGERMLTYFEATTCAAFLAFSEVPADYLILEVGLGGRLDATNVLTNPLAAIVTPVALDHENFLGTDLSEIAKEKAGIMRAGAPVVIGPQTPGVMGALERCAEETNAPTFMFGSDWNAFSEQGRLIYQDDEGLCDLSSPRLVGAHQISNASLAVAATRAGGLGFSDEILSLGIEAASWPARMQQLRKGKLVAILRDAGEPDPELWLDGGHNPHAARAVAAAFADIEDKAPRPLVLVAGMQANKNLPGYFAAFNGIASRVYAVASTQEAAAPEADIVAAAEAANLQAEVCGSVEKAVTKIIENAANNRDAFPRILICGSLFLAGEVLAQNA